MQQFFEEYRECRIRLRGSETRSFHLIVPVVVDGNEEVPGKEGGHTQQVEHQPH